MQRIRWLHRRMMPLTDAALFPSRFEISQIRWLLSFLDRHQKALTTDVVTLLADQDERVILGTFVEVPHRSRIGVADVFLDHRPRPGQCMVDRPDLVEKLILVGQIEMYAFRDD